MYLQDGAMIMEQRPAGDAGNLGDSCAETTRYYLVAGCTFGDLELVIKNFVTPKGYVRHPASPWREDDFTSDQLLPLYILFDEYGIPYERERIEKRVKEAGWKTGNGDYLSFLFISVFYRAHGRANFFTDLPILLQAIAFRWLPYRWNEATRSFERTDGSSCDWLNYYHVLKHRRNSALYDYGARSSLLQARSQQRLGCRRLSKKFTLETCSFNCTAPVVYSCVSGVQFPLPLPFYFFIE
jgi:hypothetical protein